MDKLLIKIFPLMNIAAIIGIACALALSALGVATYFGKIDMGRSFENIDPVWMIVGGLGLALTFWYKRRKIKASVMAAKTRREIS